MRSSGLQGINEGGMGVRRRKVGDSGSRLDGGSRQNDFSVRQNATSHALLKERNTESPPLRAPLRRPSPPPGVA